MYHSGHWDFEKHGSLRTYEPPPLKAGRRTPPGLNFCLGFQNLFLAPARVSTVK